jgi:uncharacterized RDD family membrane protein YckC
MARASLLLIVLLLLALSGVEPRISWAADATGSTIPAPQPEPEGPSVIPAPPAAPTEPEAPSVVPAPPATPAPPVFQIPKKHRKQARAVRGSHTGPTRVEFGTDVVIGPGETVPDLVVIAGNATVQGTVRGNLVVISGWAKVDGEVGQDLVTVLGSASLGPQAHIGHDAVVVGGPLRADPRAVIDGRPNVVNLGGRGLPGLVWLQGWLAKGLFLARPFPPQLRWVWLVAGLFLLVYLVLATIFPGPTLSCVESLHRQPIASFLLGLLVLVLLGPLCVLLAISLIGIPVIPFLACALLAAAVFGKVAVYSYAGQQLGRQMHLSNLSLPLVLLLGGVVFYLIYMVPVLGFAVWAIATLLGLGAVFLAAVGSVRHEPLPALAAEAVVAAAVPPITPPPLATGPAAPEAPITPSAPPLVSESEALLFPRVGFWKRFLATALDFLLLCLLIPLTGPVFVIVWTAYHVAMWAWKGTTIGGIVLSLKIVRVDGRPMTFAVALVRSLSSFFSAFALLLGFFWAGWDRERQSWHDKIAGTVIVKVPRSISLI